MCFFALPASASFLPSSSRLHRLSLPLFSLLVGTSSLANSCDIVSDTISPLRHRPTSSCPILFSKSASDSLGTIPIWPGSTSTALSPSLRYSKLVGEIHHLPLSSSYHTPIHCAVKQTTLAISCTPTPSSPPPQYHDCYNTVHR